MTHVFAGKLLRARKGKAIMRENTMDNQRTEVRHTKRRACWTTTSTAMETTQDKAVACATKQNRTEQ